MTTTIRRRWLAALALLACLFFAAFLWARPMLNIGAGYAAKHACSCHFLQGRALKEIRKNDLNFSVLGWTTLQKENQSVHASFLSLTPRRAIYREGIGCTLINDDMLAVVTVPEGADAGAVKGPGSHDTVELRPGLKEALDFGMAPVPGGGAHAIVIMQGGTIIAERYAKGFNQHTPLLGWSMTKSLIGLAWGARHTPTANPDSLIEAMVNTSKLYPEWATDARARIKLDDLMHMNSGLGWNEAYGGITDATVMLHEFADMSAFAAGMPLLEPPGEHWAYSSGTTNILTDLLGQKVQAEGSLIYPHLRELYGDIAPSLFIEPDQSGSPVGSSYGWATARDWTRLGQFMLQDGVWQGDTLLHPGWIDYFRTPAKGSEGQYGAQIWLKGPDMPSLPDNAFMMRGFQDQRVIILPDHQLIITRLGHNDDKVADFDGLVQRVVDNL